MARVKALTDRTLAERFTEITTRRAALGRHQCPDPAARGTHPGVGPGRRGAAPPASRALQTDGSPPGLPQRRLLADRRQPLGVLDIYQPRARTAQAPSILLSRFQRRECEVDALIRQAFLRGVSTRQVGAVLAPVLGWQPSAQTVSTIAKALDQEVQRSHWRRVDGDWLYRLLDGVTMKVKHPG